jgi:hypothetical protein
MDRDCKEGPNSKQVREALRTPELEPLRRNEMGRMGLAARHEDLHSGVSLCSKGNFRSYCIHLTHGGIEGANIDASSF